MLRKVINLAQQLVQKQFLIDRYKEHLFCTSKAIPLTNSGGC